MVIDLDETLVHSSFKVIGFLIICDPVVVVWILNWNAFLITAYCPSRLYCACWNRRRNSSSVRSEKTLRWWISAENGRIIWMYTFYWYVNLIQVIMQSCLFWKIINNQWIFSIYSVVSKICWSGSWPSR